MKCMIWRVKMKKPFAILILVLLASGLTPFATARAQQEPSGEWVLERVEDITCEDYYNHDVTPMGDVDWDVTDTRTYRYERNSFAMDWTHYYTLGNDQSEKASGSVGASFDCVMPEHAQENERISVSVEVQSSFSYRYYFEGTTETTTHGYGLESSVAYIESEGTSAPYEATMIFPTCPDSPYADNDTFDFAMPVGTKDGAFSVQVGLSIDFNSESVGTLATRYTYRWVEVEPEKEFSYIELAGLVLSAETKPMPWMKLEAKAYYGTDTYNESSQPDIVISGATDHKGRYSLRIPIPEDSEGPVGILLTGTLTCVWPYDGAADVFYFVDMHDEKSKENECLCIGSWFSVDPDDYPNSTENDPISLYRLLAFYDWGCDAWSIDMNTAAVDIIVPYSSDLKALKQLQDYSTLYTAAFDAWFFGAAVLSEEDDLKEHKLRIEVCWPPTDELKVSHFNRNDYTVRLTSSDSRQDDESRFTILHEFGHAFDFITNSGAMRASAKMGVNDTNHGGYLNESTSDSFKEGFATFYAGSVQLYSGYKNPHILSWIDLGTPEKYNIWQVNGKHEELAIASLLYQTHFLIDDINSYWSLLNPDKDNFYEYFKDIEDYLNEHNSNGSQTLKNYAYVSGLFKMPFGNGTYDLGEPFQDINRNNIWDSAEEPYTDINSNQVWDEDEPYQDIDGSGTRNVVDEPFGDLMFATYEDGKIDISKPLQDFDRSELVMGQSTDALRNRDAAQVSQTIQPAENSYLYLLGEPVEYVLVDILPDGEAGTRVLMGTADGRVLIGLPASGQTGKVMVSIPGGGTIFKGDLADLQQRFSDTTGQDVPLAEATVYANDLAPEGTQVSAAYGSTEASGVFTAPEISHQELIQLADGYNGDASIEQVIAELSDRVPIDFTQPKDEDSGVVADFPSEKTGGRLVYIIIGIVLALGAVALALVVVLFHVRSRKRSPIPVAAPYNGSRYCTRCGHSVPPGNAFCTTCGAPQPVPTYGQPAPSPKKSPALLIIGIVAAVLMLAGSIYLLFFAGQKPTNAEVMGMPATNEAWTEASQKPAAAVDYAATRDAADLIGVWEGTLEYTEISGDWETFTYPVYEGYSQPFMLKITEGSPVPNWRQAIMRIDGGDATALSAGFEGRFLEIRGEWESCDVSISVEYDEDRGGFAGLGQYIHPEKHAVFDFFMTLVDENVWDSADVPAVTASQPSPTQAAEMVSAQTITVSMAYDSGEGVYTGEVNSDGVPNGYGSFQMVSSDTGANWIYEGQWQNGEITGQGVMTQDDFVFTGSFISGLMDGYCEIMDDGILRYKGMCAGGKLHGQGTLYTSSGMLLFEGVFENDMLVENAETRQARGAAFKPECDDMDEMLYDGCMAEDNTFGYPVAVWGFPVAMGEQTANGTIVIGHMGDNSYPVCLVYRYGTDETKMTWDDWINVWGVIAGTYEYVDADGLTMTCPMVEVVYWNNDQEGL